MVFLKDHGIFKRETSIIPFYYFPEPLKYMVLINVELFTRNNPSPTQNTHPDINCLEFKGFCLSTIGLMN